MARLEEKPDDETTKQQFSDKRPMRIDAVRQQGERQLRKVMMMVSIMMRKSHLGFYENRCVNKS